MSTPDTSKWQSGVWQLYNQAWDEEKFYLTHFHHQLVFFGGFVPTLLAATIAGGIQASSRIEYLLLSAGPLVVIVMSQSAIAALTRPYQRFLEAIARKAKLEEELGMSEPRAARGDESGWVVTEPLVDARHLADRYHRQSASTEGHLRDIRSGREFVDHRLKLGVQSLYKRFFRVLQFVAAGLLATFLYSAGSM